MVGFIFQWMSISQYEPSLAMGFVSDTELVY